MVGNAVVAFVLLMIGAMGITPVLGQTLGEPVRCEMSAVWSCSADGYGIWPDQSCTALRVDGEYLLVPRIGDPYTVPYWDAVDQDSRAAGSTYARCQRNGDCWDVEVRAERVGASNVRLVGQGRWRDYTLQVEIAEYSMDPPITAVEVHWVLQSVHVSFWRCPASLSYIVEGQR